MSDILKVQRSFARKAAAQPEHQFDDLYHLLVRKEWIAQALKHVLSNQGAKTPGIDGISNADLKTETQQNEFIEMLQSKLKSGTYHPSPVRRVWIPKPGKPEKRGLGIPTIQDRVVQEMLRMLMEPIWESDFLNCSNGFRPGRRTMDCIATFYSRVQSQNKFFWAIEGDIRKCFDHIHHKTLVRLIGKRIADQRVVRLIDAFLRAGVMDGALFHDTTEGTPQGGILSPLLANIYLNELDQWWWQKFGQLTHREKWHRREAHQGNAILIRYADDFVILWNGTHENAKLLKAELSQFLTETLHLELSDEKTNVTHLRDGIDFLGFHIQLDLPTNGSPQWLRVTPTKSNIERFKARIKALTKRGTTLISPDMRFKSLNRIIRGWGNYYRHVSFTHEARELDYWINERILIWLQNKHQGRSIRWLLDKYKSREVSKGYNRWNFGTTDEYGKMVYIAKLSDIHTTKYRNQKLENPYLTATEIPTSHDAETPLLSPRVINLGLKGLNWATRRREVLARDGGRCVDCGTNTRLLDVHHIIPREEDGTDAMDNLVSLCEPCHMKRHHAKPKRVEKTSWKAG